MSNATTTQAHIGYELIEDTNHQVVMIEFLSHDIVSPVHARELGEQLHSLIRPQPHQYFVIDCAGVRSLGSTAFSEIVSFVRKANKVWVCNLGNTLRFGATLVGLDDWARFAANRRAAIEEAERIASIERGQDPFLTSGACFRNLDPCQDHSAPPRQPHPRPEPGQRPHVHLRFGR